jgi:hypothetical protein
MSNNFKKQVTQQRAAIPQVDPESVKPIVPEPIQSVEQMAATESPQQMPELPSTGAQPETKPSSSPHLTVVDTTKSPVNRGFFMYPSRHRQVVKDLVYIEDRKPWQIIEDALEEYVVRHYGKEHKRR